MNQNNATTPLQLPALVQLQGKGFDLAVLLAMQHDALMSAHRVLTLSGEPVSRESLMNVAQAALPPSNERLMQAYTETGASMASRPVRELELIAHSLTACALSLEADAAREIARDSTAAPRTTLERARGEQTIGQQLATLLLGAQTLAQSGVVATAATSRRLDDMLSFVQSGPLAPFADKARALLAARESSGNSYAPRMAMA